MRISTCYIIDSVHINLFNTNTMNYTTFGLKVSPKFINGGKKAMSVGTDALNTIGTVSMVAALPDMLGMRKQPEMYLDEQPPDTKKSKKEKITKKKGQAYDLPGYNTGEYYEH